MGYDGWAHIYDLLYEQLFRHAYAHMTAQHLHLIPSDASAVLDVGAGTGRLSIPLAQQGVHVTAVEPSAGMMKQLMRYAREAGVVPFINRVVSPIDAQEAAAEIATDHDCAACVFSTIHHITTRPALRRALRSMAGALRPGGVALVGVHPPELFVQFGAGLRRDVWIDELGGLVRWTQRATRRSRSAVLDATCSITLPDGTQLVDPLRMRPWTADDITAIGQQVGLELRSITSIGSEEVLELAKTHRPAGAG